MLAPTATRAYASPCSWVREALQPGGHESVPQGAHESARRGGHVRVSGGGRVPAPAARGCVPPERVSQSLWVDSSRLVSVLEIPSI